jgi:hypothetical protein
VNLIDIPLAYEDTVGEVILSGWGSVSSTGVPKYPSILQTINLTVIDFQSCNEAVKSIPFAPPLRFTNICTGPLTGGISACSVSIFNIKILILSFFSSCHSIF